MINYPASNDSTRLVTDSARFSGVRYEIKDSHLIIWTRKDGVLAVRLDRVGQLTEELSEMAKNWMGVRT